MAKSSSAKDYLFLFIIIITIVLAMVQVVKQKQLNTSLARSKENLEEQLKKQNEEKIVPEKGEEENKPSCGRINERVAGESCYNILCLYKDNLNFKKADTFVKYENAGKGIAFNIPYNNNWGDENCLVRPYLEKENEVLFGNPATLDFRNEFKLVFKEARSKEEILESLETEDEIERYTDISEDETTEFEYVFWRELNLDETIHIEIISENVNYYFTSLSNQEKKLTDLIESVELIDTESSNN